MDDVGYRLHFERRIHLLSEAARAFVAASSDLDALATMIVERLSAVVGGNATLMLLDAARTSLEVTAACRKTSDPDLASPPVTRFSLAEHVLLRAVIESGEPHVVAHTDPAGLDARGARELQEHVDRTGLHSLLFAPLRGAQGVLGLISMSRHHDTPAAFDAADADLASMLGQHAALAIEIGRASAAERRARLAAEEAQELLRRSEDDLRQFFDSSPIPMIVFELDDMRLLAANQAAVRMYGYAHRELVSLRVTDLLMPGEVEERSARLRGLGPDVAIGRARHRRKDGSVLEVEGASHGAPFAGRPARFAVLTDITQQAAFERERLRAVSQFERLATAGLIGVMTTDFEGRIHEMNDYALDLLGYTRDEVLAADFAWSRLPSPEWQAEHRRKIERLRTTGIEHPREREYVRKDGVRIPVLTGSATLATGDEVINFILDLRGQKWAEAAVVHLREARASETKAQLANRELEAFSYSVAHDLRAPLRGMSGFAGLLRETYGQQIDAEGRDWLDEIVANASRMDTLIDALLSLSRLTRAPMQVAQVDLGALARKVIAELAIAEPGREVETVIGDDLLLAIDPALARVLLTNLVGNAWKFTQHAPHARIELGRTTTPEGPTVFVQDNGAGFDMAFASKLFTPFQRLHAASEFPGTGVGLATAQRIVHRHGGRIWAEGRPGAGATVFFTIPTTPEEGDGDGEADPARGR